MRCSRVLILGATVLAWTAGPMVWAAEEAAEGAAADAPGEAAPAVPAAIPGDPRPAASPGSAPVAEPALADGSGGEPTAAAEPRAPVPGETGVDARGRPGRIHVVAPGDTLWDISEAYLGTPWVWPSIWKDNREIENPHLIHPGDRIWITPTEMRRVTAEEAEVLLAERPAAPEPISEAPAPEPEPVAEEPGEEIAPAPEPRPVQRVSSRESVGLIGVEEFESAASIVDAIPDRIMLGQGDAVYVGLGEDRASVGDQFTVFRTREKVFDPDTGALLGYHVDILGWLELEETHPETSRGRIRASVAEIERGDRLTPREPLPIEIAVQESPGDVDGKVSFFANGRTLMGMTDYVYLNRGSLDGLEVGSPLEVYRAGHAAREVVRDTDVRVPDRVIAQLLVVRAQPQSAVAFVTYTEEPIELGDRFRGATR